MLSVVAGYLGIASLVLWPGPLALAVSTLALRDLRRRPHRSGWGRAFFGLAMGALGTFGLLTLALHDSGQPSVSPAPR